MREKRTTYEVQEKEEEDVYCDICGVKTNQSKTLYTSARELEDYPIKNFVINTHGEGVREHATVTMSAYDVCDECMDNLGSGYSEPLYLYRDENEEQEHSPSRNNNFMLSVSALVLGCIFGVLSIFNYPPEIFSVPALIFFMASVVLAYRD